MKVGRRFFFLLSSILLFQLFIFPSFVEAWECVSAGECIPISKFDYKTSILTQKSMKKCKYDDDACAVFWCLVDGKKVIHGLGCYSDYVSYCGDVSKNAQIDYNGWVQRLGWKKKGPNAEVYSCKEGEKCAERSYPFRVKFGSEFFGPDGEFMQGADMSYDQQCEYVPAPPLSRASAMTQMNGYKLFGIILIGLMLAQFW